jgi:DNA-directed RNA polymerase subunit N (RpoN/RPB10)
VASPLPKIRGKFTVCINCQIEKKHDKYLQKAHVKEKKHKILDTLETLSRYV